MIAITDTLDLDEAEISESFIRASGPGGQNVNKVASAVQLRFDVRGPPSLPQPVRERLERLAGHRVSQDGILVITARRFRSQERNRSDALNRLVALITRAATAPRRRRGTRAIAPACCTPSPAPAVPSFAPTIPQNRPHSRRRPASRPSGGVPSARRWR